MGGRCLNAPSSDERGAKWIERILETARDESKQAGHETVDLHHLFLAVCQDPCEWNCAFHVDIAATRELLREWFVRSNVVVPALSPNVAKLLQIVAIGGIDPMMTRRFVTELMLCATVSSGRNFGQFITACGVDPFATVDRAADALNEELRTGNPGAAISDREALAVVSCAARHLDHPLVRLLLQHLANVRTLHSNASADCGATREQVTSEHVSFVVELIKDACQHLDRSE